ncbi:hypothetical protein [Ralstonia phage phiRSL1]|uniref:Uncharacterized protein n=1 Tax=Ralstonia phage phiRSL1 TaxID=1980924 RepID=B2ZY33_9CAUD|nr:hypothetical protein RSL1_ORF162 [Ralstonia phage phiRSL1]BAG41609.1 hypothetical protein [Ralstonia phage phiRSL1]
MDFKNFDNDGIKSISKGTGRKPVVRADPDGAPTPAPKRKKACYIGVPAVFQLELACQQLSEAYGETCYLVGSSMDRPDWRDVDVVLILPDDDFAREFPGVNMTVPGAWEFDPKWLIHTIALSKWLGSLTGLPIDFKIQPRTAANNLHKGPRSAMGLKHVSK